MEMRLQRALARAGVASRRAAEELIRGGQVRVDGKVATIGQKVDLATQHITVKGRRVQVPQRRWLAFHKPLGVVTSADDEGGRRTVFDFVDGRGGLTYVGRLDIMTTGLLLLTNDGDAVQRLTHPRYRIARRYTALVHGKPTAEVEKLVHQPVSLDGRPVVATGLRVRPGKDGRSILDVTLTEGRNRVVRRWAEAMGLAVERLARLSYGPVRLGDLKVGESRVLTGDEVRALYQAVRLDEEA
ncbi:MAG: pseudouridine synthase [Gemmatimonadales bacterium]|nr:pseudouridine synthase [Gemmatimonadales bacterium]